MLQQTSVYNYTFIRCVFSGIPSGKKSHIAYIQLVSKSVYLKLVPNHTLTHCRANLPIPDPLLRVQYWPCTHQEKI